MPLGGARAVGEAVPEADDVAAGGVGVPDVGTRREQGIGAPEGQEDEGGLFHGVLSRGRQGSIL